MDLVPIVNGVFAQTTSAAETVGPQLTSIMEALQANWASWLLLSVVLFATIWFLLKVSSRLFTSFEDTMFSNWRLALLGATGLVLSLASGWTTWDGMRNFTGEPALSFMITFGIQGVMLIVAWLIGESFATGMNTTGTARTVNATEKIIAMVIGVAIVGLVISLLVQGKLPFTNDVLMYAALVVGILALIVMFQSEIAKPYLQSSRIIVRNAVLWVMFLACMATSVFFSFDSLFSTIFPAQERERAAELRAQNQVSGILSDIGQSISNEQLTETQQLFLTEGWQRYENQLNNLASMAQGSQGVIEAFFVQKMEDRRRGIAEQQERKATAESQQASLTTRKSQLTEELVRLQGNRPQAANEVVQQVQVVSNVRRRMDEQRAIMLAEEKGVEGSGKVGRGPKWRDARAQLGKIEAELQVAQERLRAPRDRLGAIDQKMSSIKGQLAQIDGDIAKLRGEALTADQRILAAEKSKTSEESILNVDPSRILPAFERAKLAFRQEPTEERLTALQSQCSQLLGAMLATPTTKNRVLSIDCDPGQASEAAGTLFALRSGAVVFADRCAGGEKLEQQKSADDLFGFARKCLSDSGLSSAQTEALRKQINLAELNRDDKAHRFVVTWNAFQDGNRLAYLALAIAIAIDALVFMSGLFGANAVRSPLQDVPSNKPRSAQQLEATIENALLPDLHTLPTKFANARAALHAMQPVTPIDGFTNEVHLPGTDTPHENAVRKLLSAGSSIGAVANDRTMPGRYLVRPELFEFLSIIAKREFEGDKSLALEAKDREREVELKDVMTVALRPWVGDHSQIVLRNLHPIEDFDKKGFTSEVILEGVPHIQVPIMRRALNAGATLGFVRQRQDRTGRHHEFEVHKQLYKTLCMISAAHPMENGWEKDAEQLAGYSRDRSAELRDERRYQERGQPRDGGDLQPRTDEVERTKAPLLPDRSQEVRPDVPPAYAANAGPATSEPSEPEKTLDPNAFYLKTVEHFAGELNYGDDDIDAVMDIGRRLDTKVLRNAATKVLMQIPAEAQSISKADRSLKDSIEQIYEALPLDFVKTDDQRQALDAFKDTLQSSRILLLLSPDGAYRYMLESMVGELQNDIDDGVQDTGGERRLTCLMTHIDELDRADLDRVEGWDAVEQSLRRFEAELVALSKAA